MSLQTLSRARADALLLLVALIWGAAFVAQKSGAEHIGPLSFLALRFSLAALVLLPLALLESRKAGVPLTPHDRRGMLRICLCLCSASILQQFAMVHTSAGNAGFLTAIYIVGVPFVGWAYTGQAPRLLVVVSAGVAMAGAWLLGGGSPQGWSLGDTLILISDLAWAFHITWIGHYRALAQRPMTLSFAQCLTTALASIPVACLLEPWQLDAVRAAVPAIAFAGLLSSVIAFTLQIVAQRHTPAAEAALIMSLESVFAAITGAIVLGESMSWAARIGAALIFLAVLQVELGAYLVAAIRARWSGRKSSTA